MTVVSKDVVPVHSIDYRTEGVTIKAPANSTEWVIPVVDHYEGLCSEIVIFNRAADVLEMFDEPNGGVGMPLPPNAISQLEGWFDYIKLTSPNDLTTIARLTYARFDEIRMRRQGA